MMIIVEVSPKDQMYQQKKEKTLLESLVTSNQFIFRSLLEKEPKIFNPFFIRRMGKGIKPMGNFAL